ncbi:MAG: insulinase family protein [Gemmatimonadaceae bacterium]|nr:insulinase family protein [Gloeobacterales cyanobacterium ES-bin-141]
MRGRAHRVLFAAGLSAALCLVPLALNAQPDTSDAVSLAPVVFSDRTLSNGLRVLLIEDHSSPTVAIHVGYHVGGKDDPPGRSGFAHLFEHLMFKGTANTEPETLDRLTEDVGGFNNAYTAEDLTGYFEVVPSNYLETLLWAEADRLRSLNVDATNFKTERDVVLGEYGQVVLSQPYGMLYFSLLDGRSYTRHPYRRGVIGTPAELKAATLTDVQRFHATHYRPDNATLVVAGDFDPAEASSWIDRYFGEIPKPPGPRVQVAVREPAQKRERRFTYYAANVPLPAVAFTYHATSLASPDATVLQVIENILSSGESARLYRTLVYTQQLAAAVTADADLREQPGIFTVVAILNAGKKTQTAYKALDTEINKLQTTLVGEAELEKARTQLVSDLVRGREENEDRALELVRTTILMGDPNLVNRRLADIQSVSAADVQRVARKYLRQANRTVINYLPGAMKPRARTR